MKVFLSYPAADRKLAERLREELSRDGLSVVTCDAHEKPGGGWQKQVEDAIRSADDILVLIGSRNGDDAAQQFEWRAALEAVWQDSHKRLIPILLRDAALPPFVFGDASGNETQVVRIVDPRDVRSAAQAIRGALRRASQKPLPRSRRDTGESDLPGAGKSGYPVSGDDPSPMQNDEGSRSGSVDVGPKSGYPVEEERTDRLLELEKLAERLRR